MGFIEEGSRFDRKAYINARSSLSFNTNDDLVNIQGLSTIQFDKGFTISCFLHIDSAATNSFQRFFVMLDSGNLRFITLERPTSTSERFRFVSGANTFETPNISPSVWTDKWVHYVCVYDKATLSIKQYINGVLAKSDVLISPLVFSIGDYIRIGSNITDTVTRRYYGELAHFSIFNRELTQDEISYIHRYVGHLYEDIAVRLSARWTFQQDIYKADASFSAKHQFVSVNDLVVLEDSNNYNALKEYIHNWNIGDAGDAGDSTLENVITATFIGGLITQTSTGTPSSSNNFALYLQSESFPVSDGRIRSVFNITASGGTGVVNFLLRKSGETSVAFDIASGGTFTFEYTWENINNAPIEFGLQDTDGSNNGQTLQINYVRFYSEDKPIIDFPAHGVLTGKTDDDVGAINRSSRTDINDFYTLEGLRDVSVKLTSNKGAIASTMNTIGTGDFSLVFHFSSIADFTTGRFVWILSPYTTAYAYLSVSKIGFILFRAGSPQIAITQVDLGLISGIPSNTKCIVLITWENTDTITMSVKVKGLSPVVTKSIIIPYTFTGLPSNKNLCQSGLGDDIYHLSEHHRVITFNEAENLSFITPPELDLDFSDIQGTSVRDKITNIPYSLTGFTGDESLLGSISRLEIDTFFPKASQYLQLDGINHYISTKNPFDPAGDVFTIYVEATTFDTSPGGTWDAKTIVHAGNLLNNNDVISVTLRNPNPTVNANNSGIPSLIVRNGAVVERAIQNIGQSKLYDGLFSTLIQYDTTADENGTFFINDLVKITKITGIVSPSSDFADINLPLHIGRGALGSYTKMNFGRLLIWNRKLNRTEWENLSGYKNPASFDSINKMFPQDGLILYLQGQEGSFFEGTSNPELRNLAPASNFPVGSATTPDYWDCEAFGYTGATASDKLTDLRTNISNINTLR